MVLTETLIGHFLLDVIARAHAWLGGAPFSYWASLRSWLNLGQNIRVFVVWFSSILSIHNSIVWWWFHSWGGVSSFLLQSYMSPDVASGKEMSDSFEGAIGSGKQEGKSSKKHKKSTRARSRQEKTNRPKLTILNASTLSLGINSGLVWLCQK